jgi:anti-sigma factor RsiW
MDINHAKAPRRRFGWLQLKWVPLGLAAGAAVIVLAVVMLPRLDSARQRADEELVSAHIRSLMATHLVDVPSSDQHTVKPWFNGRLDFSPPVIDLAPRNFPLVGGRLDYLNDHAVAALVYQRRKHYINLFIRPGGSGRISEFRTAALRGYNIIAWSDSQMNFAAVSDLNAPELAEFARLLDTILNGGA